MKRANSAATPKTGTAQESKRKTKHENCFDIQMVHNIDAGLDGSANVGAKPKEQQA